MSSISLDSILRRANDIRTSFETGSITPEKLGVLINDIAIYVQILSAMGLHSVSAKFTKALRK